MDKKTLLAVVLSVIVMTGAFFWQSKNNPSVPESETEQIKNDNDETYITDESNLIDNSPKEIFVVDESIPSKNINVQTNLMNITFNTSGAVISSLILNNFEDYNSNEKIEMINSINDSYSAFNLSFENDYNFINDNFNYESKGNGIHEFYRDFQTKNYDGSLSDPFRVVKRYTFVEGEFLFKIDISIIDSPYRSYTMSFGPDIGPTFKKLDNRTEYRRFYSYDEGKRSKHKVKNGMENITNQVDWIALNGKYFALIVVPENKIGSITLNKDSLDNYKNSSEIFISNNIRSNITNDTFYVYAGPKSKGILDIYNSGSDNYFNLSNNNFSENIDSASIPGLGWLSDLLKIVLDFINGLIPNYGIAIILLTVLIKVLLYPITHKSMESTTKMQTVQPKLKKLQEQYKNKPAELNAATAELYKKEGVNPLGGCLPMLLQMPVFFALYGLLNSYFGLRGAVFIPGWINDLSSPESIFTLPFAIPLLGWTAVRLLPFLYLGTQLIMSKFTQATSAGAGQSNAQMKMLTLGMPIMFFFILYDMASGLLLYWTMTNLLTAVQQYFINKKKKVNA